jgi:cytosine/adenosine deaminase-related metal-dependent hydrolase
MLDGRGPAKGLDPSCTNTLPCAKRSTPIRYYRTVTPSGMNHEDHSKPRFFPDLLAQLGPAPDRRILRLRARSVIDAAGVHASPGEVLVEVRRWPNDPGTGSSVELNLLAAGAPGTVAHHPATGSAQVVDLPEHLLLPALVNAHTHLDLTHVGPRPFDRSGGFVGWIDVVRHERHASPVEIGASVRAGIGLLQLGGVAAVGDIAGCPSTGPTEIAAIELARSGILGTSFIEYFGIGKGRDRGPARAREAVDRCARSVRTHWRPGISPHATNTVAAEAYRRSLEEHAMPIATHVAETPEEREFIATGRGTQRDLLVRMGVWDDAIVSGGGLCIGQGCSPVEHVARILDHPSARARPSPIILVHVNDCTDADLDRLAGLRASGVAIAIAYCPRSSSYFHAHEHFGPHRYREMMARGIPVALGTDSIINLGTEALTQGISTWGEMAHLHQRDAGHDGPADGRRDGLDAGSLLGMATTAGARALGLDPHLFTFQRMGPIAGVLGVVVEGPASSAAGDLFAALSGTAAGFSSPQFLLNGNKSCRTAT